MRLDPVAATDRSVPGMRIKSRTFQPAGRDVQTLALAGLIGALAASSCCILPVLLFSLGISGAWIANFTQLAPYQPFFGAATVALLGTGYWLVYRSSRSPCVGDQACARGLWRRVVMIALVAATVIVIAAFAFDFVAPYLLS